MLFNPLQYFVSCIWLPISPGEFDGQSVNLKIKYGWWEMNTYGRLLRSTTPIHKTSYLALNPHPQTARGSYLNSAPYTRKFIRYMPFGTFEIDPQFFPSNTNVILYLSIDVITGAGILRVAKEASGGAWLSYQTLQAQIGVPIQMSQITTQFQNVINGVGAMFAGGAAGATIAGPAGALLGAVGSIGNALDAFIPAVQSTGMNGGIASLDNDITCTHYFSIIVDEDNVDLGRPYCKYVQLSTLSGFTVCETGEINIQCMAEERERIASYLTGGFYIE